MTVITYVTINREIIGNVILSCRCDFNEYTISYILRIGELKSAKNISKYPVIRIDDESFFDASVEQMDTD